MSATVVLDKMNRGGWSQEGVKRSVGGSVCRGFGFVGGALAPLLGGFSFVLRELSTVVTAPTTCCSLTTCSLTI